MKIYGSSFSLLRYFYLFQLSILTNVGCNHSLKSVNNLAKFNKKLNKISNLFEFSYIRKTFIKNLTIYFYKRDIKLFKADDEFYDFQ